MKSINIFCFGFGQVAKSFIKKLNLEKININLSVTSREKSKKKQVDGITYHNYHFNDFKYDKDLIVKLKNSDYILISIPPVNGVDIVVKNFKEEIKKSNPRWITYLSATSVYGNHNGNWVDELSKTEPTSINGIDRLNSEKTWLNFSAINNLKLQIFRLSGIYSNTNNVLIKLKKGEVKIINKKNHFFSRIHLEDISNILFKSLFNFKPREIYNVSDDKPSSSKEITLYAVKILNINKPDTVKISDIKNQMLKSFYNDSKKVNNRKMKKFFKYNLKFPTYMEGLNNIKKHLI